MGRVAAVEALWDKTPLLWVDILQCPRITVNRTCAQDQRHVSGDAR